MKWILEPMLGVDTWWLHVVPFMPHLRHDQKGSKEKMLAYYESHHLEGDSLEIKPEFQVEQIPISQLHPSGVNPVPSVLRINMLKDEFDEEKLTPLWALRDGQIIDGVLRWHVFIEMGITHAPVIWIGEETEDVQASED